MEIIFCLIIIHVLKENILKHYSVNLPCMQTTWILLFIGNLWKLHQLHAEVMLLPPALDELATSPSCFTHKMDKRIGGSHCQTVTFPLCPSIILCPAHMVGRYKAQYTFNHATRRRPMTRFTTWPLFQGKGPQCPQDGRLGGPYSHLDALKRKISQLCWGILIPVIQPTAQAPQYIEWTIPVWCDI